VIRYIERALNLRAGELRLGAPLTAYLFLVMASYLVGRVVRDSLFLSRFPAAQLPYADIATALTVGALIAVYIRLGRHFSLRGLLLGSLVFFASNCLLFWVLARFYLVSWLYPVIYIWDGMFGVLAPTQVWTLANHVLTTREARRVFGLLAGGAIAGGIFAGFFSKVVAKTFGTESLLLGMAIFLFACLPLVVVIWGYRQEVVPETESPEAAERPRNLRESVALVLSSTYLRAIAGLIGVSSLVTEVISWQFKAVAQAFIPAKDHLAAFFGDFTFYAGILALIVQLLVTSRFLRRFGIGVALFTLPLGLVVTSVYMLLTGTLLSVILLRGADWVWRYSIDKSTVELLYLPLPSRIKFQVKWCIDTVIWRMGTGLAGLTVLLFITYWGFTARQMNWVVLVLIGAWLASAWVARKQYLATLKESIRDHRAAAEPPVLDRSTAEVLNASLSASDHQEVLYALSILESGRQASQRPIRVLLNHPAAEVRKKAISVLDAGGDNMVVPQMEVLLQDPSLEVRTEALLYLAHHTHVDPLERIERLGDFDDFSVRSSIVAFLARPGEAQNLEFARHLLAGMVEESGPGRQRTRAEAARLLGILPDKFDPLLTQLLADADVEVVREAILSVGKLQKRRLVPALLDRLADPQFMADVTEALTRFGDTISGRLRDHFSDPAVPIEVRQQVSVILARMGTQSAFNALVEHLLDADSRLRLRILSDLSTLHHLRPQLKCDAELLEMLLAAEILGHYRSYQILERLATVLPSYEPLAGALSESMKLEVDRIFRVLDLLYPRDDFSGVYFGLQSGSMVLHDNALEFLDNVLKTQFRRMLVPLLDPKVSLAERVSIANRLVPARIESSEQAIAVLVASNDPCLRSCGAHAVGIFRLKSLEPALNRCLDHPDPLLRETARQAKLRLQSSGPHGPDKFKTR
jgi:ATP/ADP translocase/HEAT repeat protein